MTSLVFLSSRFPLPIKGGREQMIIQLLTSLNKKFKIYFVYPNQSNSVDENLLQTMFPGIEMIQAVDRPLPLEQILNLCSGKSLQESIFFSKKTSNFINKLITRFNIQLCYVDMIRMAPYGLQTSITKVLDYDDLLSLRYARALESGGSFKQLLGSYENKFSKIFSFFVKLLPTQAVLNIEQSKIKKREIYYARHYDALSFVSPVEAESFRMALAEAGVSKITFPHPPTANSISCRVPECGQKMLFVGNTSTPQNYKTVMYIAKEILPHLDDRFTLEIIGHACNDLREAIRGLPPVRNRVRFLGFVDDITAESLNSNFLLAPMFYGTGIKLKILHAFSLGIPVITNSMGAEGIPIENGKDAMIADTAQELLNACNLLSNDPILQRNLILNGHALINKHFTPDNIESTLFRSLKAAMKRDISEPEVISAQ